MPCLQNSISRISTEILNIWYPMIGKELSQMRVLPRRLAVIFTDGVNDVRNLNACVFSFFVCV